MATASLSERASINKTKILTDNGTASEQITDDEIISAVQHVTKSHEAKEPIAASESSSEITQHLAGVEDQDSVAFPHQFNFLIAPLKIVFTTLILVLPVLLWFVFATLRFVFEELENAFANIASTKEFLQNQSYTIKENENKTDVEQEIKKQAKEYNCEITAEIQRLQKENADLSTKLQHLEDDNVEQSTEVLRLHNENTDLATKVFCLEEEIKRHPKEQNVKITAEIQRLQNENTDLTTKLQHLKDNFEKTSEVQRLQDDNIDLTTKVLRLEEENDQIKVENSNLKTINNLLQEDSSSVTHMALKPLVDLQLNGLEFFERTNQLQQEISSLNNQNLHLRQEMEGKIQQHQEENVRKNCEIQQHVDDKRKKSNEIRQLQLEKHLIEKEKQQLQELKSSTESQMDNQIQQLRQEKNDLEHKNLQLREVIIRKNNEIQEYEENNRNVSNEIRQLQDENDNMSHELQSLRQENNNMEIEIQQLHENTTSSIITERGSVTFSADEVLGRGGWGAVYTGDFYGTKVAVKEYHELILSPHNLEILKREINIASQCRHPNLLQMICATKNEKNRLLIVTELMDMDLRSLLEQQANENSRLEHFQVKSISLDVARGLNYLHSKTPNPIIHRDVSSANVLLWMENGSVRRAKISDYGSANFMEACNTKFPGASLYAAPEADQFHHTPKLDVFSYGLLVCEIYNCKTPEKKRRGPEIRKIKNDRIKRLVTHCTEVNPQKRPTMQDVIGSWQLIE